MDGARDPVQYVFHFALHPTQEIQTNRCVVSVQNGVRSEPNMVMILDEIGRRRDVADRPRIQQLYVCFPLSTEYCSVTVSTDVIILVL